MLKVSFTMRSKGASEYYRVLGVSPAEISAPLETLRGAMSKYRNEATTLTLSDVADGFRATDDGEAAWTPGKL